MTLIEPPPPPSLPIYAALFLDFDGTLVEIADVPSEVIVPPDIPLLLERLSAQLDGSLAVVSGRRVEDLGDRLKPFRGVIVGLHGLEHRSASGKTVHRRSIPAIVDARSTAQSFVAAHRGVMLEDKEQTLAIHYRRAPEQGAACIEMAERIVGDARGELMLRHGKMLVEIGPPRMNKGTAIEALMRMRNFRGRIPVFFGDDCTDEDGFAAVNRLGGLSIRIGEAQETLARYRLEDVPAVIAHLTDFVGESAIGNIVRGASA